MEGKYCKHLCLLLTPATTVLWPSGRRRDCVGECQVRRPMHFEVPKSDHTITWGQMPVSLCGRQHFETCEEMFVSIPVLFMNVPSQAWGLPKKWWMLNFGDSNSKVRISLFLPRVSLKEAVLPVRDILLCLVEGLSPEPHVLLWEHWSQMSNAWAKQRFRPKYLPESKLKFLKKEIYFTKISIFPI